MQAIGERLEEARKRLGIALREASEATKIRTDYLQEIENGTFDFPLPEVYKRGFLKNYAQYLKLDGSQLLAEYDAQHAGASSPARPAAENLGRVEVPGSAAPAAESAGVIESYDSAAMQNRATVIRWATVLVIVLVVVIIFVGLRGLFSGSSPDQNTPPASATDNSASLAPAAPPKPMVQFSLSAQNDITSLSIQLLSDHSVLYSGPLKRGQALPIDAPGPVEIRVSQTQNLIIKHDGQTQKFTDPAGKSLTGPTRFDWPANAAP
jgi:cytoskeleton protein RodZ